MVGTSNPGSWNGHGWHVWLPNEGHVDFRIGQHAWISTSYHLNLNPSSDLRIFFFNPHEVHRIDHKYVGLVIGKVGGGFFVLHRLFRNFQSWNLMDSRNWRWTPKKLENDSSSCAQDISSAFQCQIVLILPRMDQPSSPSRSSLGPSAWESPTVYRKLREEWACQGWARLSHVPKRLLSQDVWSCGCLRNDPVLFVLALVEGRNLQEWLHQFPRFSQKTIHWQPADSETDTYEAQILCSQGATCTATYCDCRVQDLCSKNIE